MKMNYCIQNGSDDLSKHLNRMTALQKHTYNREHFPIIDTVSLYFLNDSSVDTLN